MYMGVLDSGIPTSVIDSQVLSCLACHLLVSFVMQLTVKIFLANISLTLGDQRGQPGGRILDPSGAACG